MAQAALEYAESDLSVCGGKTRGLIEQKFSWEKNVEALVEVYRERA